MVDSSDALGDPVALRARAARDGYLRLPGIHDRRAISELRAFVLAACERLGWLAPHAPRDSAIPSEALRGFDPGDPRGVELQTAVLPSAEMDRIRRAPAVLAVLRALLDAEPLPHQGDVCRVVFPNAREHTTPPHQDGAYVGIDRECWTVWTPLVDCPLRLGPLAVLPGSHRGGLIEHSAGLAGAAAAPDDGWAVAEFAAGDALLFHQLTLHGALPNLGGSLRLSVDCRYRAVADHSPLENPPVGEPEGRS